MSVIDWPRDNSELVSQLARQRDRYEALVNNMSDLLMLLEPDGRVAFTNKPPDAPGQSQYPAVGDNVLDRLSADQRPLMRNALDDVLNRRAVVREVVLEVRDGNGAARIIEGTLMPVVDGARVAQIEVLGRDVTERHRSAEALRQANEQLQHRQEQFQSDLDVANKIHMSLLPTPLQTDRILIDLKHIPLIGVGGDYVYIQSSDPLRPAVAVFDVSGHGIAAALVANRVHSAVYSVMGKAAQPPDMIRRINRFVYDSFADHGIFVTLFAAQMDLAANSLCFCGAGHPPALLRKADGQVIALASEHLPIGVAPDIFMGQPSGTAALAPGDSVWFYTDGLIELRKADGRMMGIAELTARVRDWPMPATPAPGIAADFMRKAMQDYEAPDDDLTVVVAVIE